VKDDSKEIGQQDRLLLSDDKAIWCEVSSHLLVLLLASGEYLALNRSAVPLWNELARGTTLAGLAAYLVERYTLPSSRAELDALEFVSRLVGLGLVHVTRSQ
jgi:hypothetical protein